MKTPIHLGFAFALLGAASCDKLWLRPHPSSARVQPEAEAEPSAISHRVNKGETLFKIAKQYTGRGQNWKTIAAYNVGIKPGALRPGQEILIPVSLLPADAINYAGLDGNPKLTYARFSLKADNPAQTAKASTKSKTAKRETTQASAQKKIANAPVARQAPSVKNPPIIKAKANTKVAPIVGDTPILQAPVKELDAVGDTAPITKAAPIAKVPPMTASISDIDPIPAPSMSVKTMPVKSMPVKTMSAKRNSERVITAKTRVQKLEPEKSAIISKHGKTGSPRAHELAVDPSEPVEQEQSSRSSFYSCMADKCSLHNF